MTLTPELIEMARIAVEQSKNPCRHGLYVCGECHKVTPEVLTIWQRAPTLAEHIERTEGRPPPLLSRMDGEP